MRFPERWRRSDLALPVRPWAPRVVSAFIMPCGFCTPCGAGRDDLCDNFFAMNRLKGTLYDGTSRLRRAERLADRDVLDGRSRRIRRRPGDRRLPAGRRPAARRVRGARLRDLHGVWRRAARGRPARRRTHRGRRRRRRRDQHHPDRARRSARSQIIAVDVRDDKLEAAKRLGATDVVNAATTDATARVRELTDGKGVDVAFEVLGLPQTFTQAFDMIRDGGRMVAVGIAPGKTTAPVEITRLVRRELGSSARTARAPAATCPRSSASRPRASSGPRRW